MSSTRLLPRTRYAIRPNRMPERSHPEEEEIGTLTHPLTQLRTHIPRTQTHSTTKTAFSGCTFRGSLGILSDS